MEPFTSNISGSSFERLATEQCRQSPFGRINECKKEFWNSVFDQDHPKYFSNTAIREQLLNQQDKTKSPELKAAEEQLHKTTEEAIKYKNKEESAQKEKRLEKLSNMYPGNINKNMVNRFSFGN